MDRKFVMTALGYGILGLLLGIYMASTKNHTQLVTHAHVMLVGFVVSFIYAVCYKLWISNVFSSIANVQFYLHLLGSIALLASLFLLFSGLVAEAVLGPILGISSIAILASMILLKVLVIKSTRIESTRAA